MDDNVRGILWLILALQIAVLMFVVKDVDFVYGFVLAIVMSLFYFMRDLSGSFKEVLSWLRLLIRGLPQERK
jgi:MFS superfamily sulfate permease-like transporter